MTEQVTLIPGGIDSRRQHDITMPADEAIKFTIRRQPLDIVMFSASKEVLRITEAGELIIQDPTEAALALQEAWLAVRSQSA